MKLDKLSHNCIYKFKMIYWRHKKTCKQRQTSLIYLPKNNVDDEYFESLIDNHPVHIYSKANFWTASFWVLDHLIQKIAVFIDEKGSEAATPEEEEGHTQVENCVKILSFPYFAHKSVV